MKVCFPLSPYSVIYTINLLTPVPFCLGRIRLSHFATPLLFSVDRRVCSILSSLVFPFLAIYLPLSYKYVVLKVEILFLQLKYYFLAFDLLWIRAVRSRDSHCLLPARLASLVILFLDLLYLSFWFISSVVSQSHIWDILWFLNIDDCSCVAFSHLIYSLTWIQ